MELMEITDRVAEIVKGYSEDYGIELIEVIFRREGPAMVLRIIVDTLEGIKLSECADLNNYLSEALDEEDLIQDRYTIEVSSPGLDRPIKTDRDFERSMGKELELTTFETIDGRKTHEGALIGMDKENIIVERQGISIVIPRNKVALARLKIEF
jgi:ribosome maturation factor RimP